MGHLVIKDNKSFDANIEKFVRNGCPCYVDFESEDSLKYINWVIEMDLSMGKEFIPGEFSWNIISENKEEVEELNEYLRSYMESRD